jgi:hypothetical protein
MLKNYLQIYNLSIVVVGDFNPVIIQPFWLANKKLIREQEAQTAKVEIIHQEIVRYSLDWVNIEITKDKFTLSSKQEPFFEPLKDLAISIFSILAETPVRAIGLNHLKHFSIPDKTKHYQFGNVLAPLSNFKDSFEDPRLFNLEIIEQPRRDDYKGIIRTRIYPSDVKLQLPFGVAIDVNDHYDIGSEKYNSANEMVKILSSQWASSIKKSEEIVENIWSKINS